MGHAELRHPQRRDVISALVRPDDNFDVLIQVYEEPQQPFNRELPKLSAKHFGYVRLANSEQIGGILLLQAATRFGLLPQHKKYVNRPLIPLIPQRVYSTKRVATIVLDDFNHARSAETCQRPGV